MPKSFLFLLLLISPHQLLLPIDPDLRKIIPKAIYYPSHFLAHAGVNSLLTAQISRGDYLVDESDDHGRTPLHYAALYGHMFVVQSLLGLDAQVHVKDNYGFTPELLAALNNHRHISNILKEYHELDRELDEELAVAPRRSVYATHHRPATPTVRNMLED